MSHVHQWHVCPTTTLAPSPAAAPAQWQRPAPLLSGTAPGLAAAPGRACCPLPGHLQPGLGPQPAAPGAASAAERSAWHHRQPVLRAAVRSARTVGWGGVGWGVNRRSLVARLPPPMQACPRMYAQACTEPPPTSLYFPRAASCRLASCASWQLHALRGQGAACTGSAALAGARGQQATKPLCTPPTHHFCARRMHEFPAHTSARHSFW